uniref:Uncharacterized protein n=1 Tax=Populus trichocarpa TaxID=3694 RepID=A9PHV4_POPTR|nr:unknown [Populus trichocarpa]
MNWLPNLEKMSFWSFMPLGVVTAKNWRQSWRKLLSHFKAMLMLLLPSLTQLQMISQVILTTSKDSPQFSLGQLLESWCSMKEIGPSKTSLISLRRTGIKLANKNLQKKKSQLKNKSQLKMNFEKNISI